MLCRHNPYLLNISRSWPGCYSISFLLGRAYSSIGDYIMSQKCYLFSVELAFCSIYYQFSYFQFFPKNSNKKGAENIVPDQLSVESIELRYFQETVDIIAVMELKSSNDVNYLLITDPFQDQPLFYFKDLSIQPDAMKSQLARKKN